MAVGPQQPRELADHPPGQLGSLQRQPAIELHKAGADQDLGIGLPAARHPADTDESRPVRRQPSGNGGKDMRRSLEQGRARQAA